jgi:hypothetical protein
MPQLRRRALNDTHTHTHTHTSIHCEHTTSHVIKIPSWIGSWSVIQLSAGGEIPFMFMQMILCHLETGGRNVCSYRVFRKLYYFPVFGRLSISWNRVQLRHSCDSVFCWGRTDLFPPTLYFVIRTWTDWSSCKVGFVVGIVHQDEILCKRPPYFHRSPLCDTIEAVFVGLRVRNEKYGMK